MRFIKTLIILFLIFTILSIHQVYLEKADSVYDDVKVDSKIPTTVKNDRGAFVKKYIINAHTEYGEIKFTTFNKSIYDKIKSTNTNYTFITSNNGYVLKDVKPKINK